MPRHVNPTVVSLRAIAPYNFVPLPERIFTVADGIEVAGTKIKLWEAHDRFVPGTYNGWIELEIETLTPLYIRGPVTHKDGVWDQRPTRLRSQPYTAPDGRPVIPGSSLRGMVRALVEILSFAKIQPVSEAKPFFRTVAPGRIGTVYGERLRQGEGVQAGRIIRRGENWMIQPCPMLRVERSKLPQSVHDGNIPHWNWQQKRCWVQHQDQEVTAIQFNQPGATGWSGGMLVLTGDVPRKKREFVFLDPDDRSAATPIPEDIGRRFHDEDQITQWQEKAFPKSQPPSGRRRAAGHLRDGEPVFFVVDEGIKSDDNPGGLVFLGRAGMFRFPYDLSPHDLVPKAIREAALDLAEAMFGRVVPDGAIKGRVFFQDAHATKGGPEWFEDLIVPRILSAPKVTTFQHYLTQDGAKVSGQLTTYLKGDQTSIRGHKLYWHRWDDAKKLDLVKEPERHADLLRDLQQPEPQDTQHTIIRPVKMGVSFAGRVRFENLTDIELGALLEAFELPDSCHHRLGMGKPLGLGSIQITARLRLVDRAARYRSWQESGVQEDETGRRFRETFSKAIIEHAQTSNETLLPGQSGLRQIARLDTLYRLLSWAGRPSPDTTEYMDLPRFKERPVLPTPHVVAGKNEPPWRQEPPQPGSHTSAPGSRPRRGGRTDQGAPPHSRPPRGRHIEGPPRERLKASPPPAPLLTPKPIQQGQTPTGILKLSADRWVAVFEGDPREAQITNPEKIPADCSEGSVAEFFIVAQSKKIGIRCRFERLREGPKA